MFTVISFEDSETESELVTTPEVLECVVRKNGVCHRVYYNISADSQMTHSNSICTADGYTTDSYIFADLFDGQKKLCVLGSFMRKDGKSLIDQWVKETKFIYTEEKE